MADKDPAARQEGSPPAPPAGETSGEEAVARHDASPEAFEAWVKSEVASWPVAPLYPELAARIPGVVGGLRARLLERSKETWLRLGKKKIIKELNECLPVVSRALSYVEQVDLPPGKLVTIVDLCSGVGYMSILLAELLSGNPKVARFVLVDNAFPMFNQETKSHHIKPDHLCKDGLFPFELTYRKYDLKSSSVHRQMQQHLVGRANGPIVVLGVHLCGLLSIRAVQFYNDNPRAALLVLKPCCLPPIILARQKYVWTLSGHDIPAKDVAADGKYNKGRWTGPPKHQQAKKFKKWAAHLLEGIDVGERGAKAIEDITLVPDREHFQTLFAFAERPWEDRESEGISEIGGEPPIKPKKKDKFKKKKGEKEEDGGGGEEGAGAAAGGAEEGATGEVDAVSEALLAAGLEEETKPEEEG